MVLFLYFDEIVFSLYVKTVISNMSDINEEISYQLKAVSKVLVKMPWLFNILFNTQNTKGICVFIDFFTYVNN